MTTSITVDYSSSTDKITAMINSAAKAYKAGLIHYVRIAGSDNAEYISVTNSITGTSSDACARCGVRIRRQLHAC